MLAFDFFFFCRCVLSVALLTAQYAGSCSHDFDGFSSRFIILVRISGKGKRRFTAFTIYTKGKEPGVQGLQL
jgi:hypothetical protein